MVPPWIVELQRINAERDRLALSLPTWYYADPLVSWLLPSLCQGGYVAPYVSQGLNPLLPDQSILGGSIIPGIL